MGQTWNGNVVHDAGNVLSDIGSFFSGPPGDPGRIRQIASQIDGLQAQFSGAAGSLNGAVDTLTAAWTGDGASAFHATWYDGGAGPAPAQVLSNVGNGLSQFANSLRQYADQLEHAQHEHWIMIGVMVALTIVNVAQLGMDPATDAAEVGAGAAVEVTASMALSSIATFAVEGAIINFTSDVISQLGADLWDSLDSGYTSTNHTVPLFNVQEAGESALSGAVSFGLTGMAGLAAQAWGGRLVSTLLENPLSRTFTVSAFSGATDAATQWITTGHVDWTQALVTAGISGLASNLVPQPSVGFADGDPADPGTYPSLPDLMGQDRYDQFLAEVQAIKAAHPDLASIPDDELVAIRGYTDGTRPGPVQDYEMINAALRNGDPQQLATWHTYIDKIQDGLQQLPDFQGTVYRGVRTLPPAAVASYEQALASGDPVTHPAFTSSSVDPTVPTSPTFKGNGVFVIESAHGKDITEISVYGQEREILFSAGSRFEVLGVSEVSPGIFEIQLAEVP